MALQNKLVSKTGLSLLIFISCLGPCAFAQECMDGYIDFGTGDDDDACHNVDGWYQTSGEDKWMTLNGDQYVDLWTDYPNEAHTLSFVHYDGLCDDSFNLYANGYNVFSYDHGTDTGPITEEVNIPAYMIESNVVELGFANLATDECGHAGIDWIRLEKIGGTLKEDGEYCDYSSECLSENCLHGICCAYGETCCDASYVCAADEICGPDYYCIPTPDQKELCEECGDDDECSSGICDHFDDDVYRCTTSAYPDVGCCPDGHHMEYPEVGVDCCMDNGCEADQACVDYVCVSENKKGICEECSNSMECESGYCRYFSDETYKCASDSYSALTCCGDKTEIKDYETGVDCCSITDCSTGYTCTGHKCVSSGQVCGDGVCSAPTETSANCTTDCGNSNGNNTQIQCTDEDCSKTIQCLSSLGGCMVSIG